MQWEADARTWVFTYVGPQAARLLGYPVERWLQPDFWAAHVHPDDREWAVRFCEQATREREAFEFEYRMIAASGQSIWVHDIVAVDRVDGAPAVIRGFLIDVSQRKWAEATARASEARFRQLIEQAPDAIIAVRSEGQIAFVNRQAERMFGYRRGELVGRGFEHLVPEQPDVQRLMAQQADGRSLEADGTGDDTAPITGMARDGKTFPAEINFSPLDTDEGLVIVSTIRDISRRLAVETALRRSEERFRIAATLGADIIAEVDIKTGDVEWFGQVDEALGYERGEFPRTFDGWARQLHPEDRERVLAEVEREVVELRRRLSAECRIKAKDGSYRHWSVRVAPRLEGQGRPTRFVVVCSDVTEQIVAEALQHRDALAHVARVSSLGELTATLAHELNQPLAAILSNAQTAIRLLDRDQPDGPAGSGGAPRHRGGRPPGECNHPAAPGHDETGYRRAAAGRSVSGGARGPGDHAGRAVPARDHGRARLRRGSAGGGGGPDPDSAGGREPGHQRDAGAGRVDQPASHAWGAGRDDGWQVVSVADTGPGIAASALDTMFEPFTGSRPGGLGMGLSISRSIIEAHGGKIWGENRPDAGAIVGFGLPPEGVTGA